MADGPASTAAAADPRHLEVGAAALEIRQACDELGAEAHRSPFFFVVGAGVSFPPVPLAGHIIEHCQKVAARYQRNGVPRPGATLDTYSYWFSAAYPGARQRQQYLRSLIEHKALSLSSLRLAHLLSVHKLTNLVVTTNFDDFIARALRLFGEEPVVCDHPRTVGRIDRERPDVQIVHVHGSYLFYDCANLRGEVTDRARADDETSFTMVGLLDSLLWSRSPIVIGYSGWEGDVIMSALRRRLRGGNPLAQSVYWCCYRRAEIDQLPPWLRDSADVRFVVAAEVPLSSADGAPQSRISGDSSSPERTDPTLSAVTVLDQINRAFEIGDPTLFADPVEHLARSLEGALPDASAPAGDPYAFKALIERLRALPKDFRQPATVVQPSAGELDRLRALMRESNYREAAALLAGLVPTRLKQLSPDERHEVLGATELVASSLQAEGGKATLEAHAAHVLVFDSALDRMLGTMPDGMVWILASRTGQMGFENVVDGKVYGALGYHLANCLDQRSADLDKDGQISLREAVIAAARQVLRQTMGQQSPTVAGDADRVALFSSRKRGAGAGTSRKLLALLVGVATYRRREFDLSGPANDVEHLRARLAQADGRLTGQAEILPLLDERATAAEVRSHLHGMCQASGPEDTVLFYFSGRGVRRETMLDSGPRSELALALHDVDVEVSNGITHREILDALQGAKAAHKIVMLDF